MNKPEQSNQGKIASRFQGVGTVTPEMVQERASEIARINGRTATILDQDFEEAYKELTGGDLIDEERDDSTIVSSTPDWDDQMASKGRIVAATPAGDEQTDAERLTQQGVDEAEHETMLEGLKNPKNQE